MAKHNALLHILEETKDTDIIFIAGLPLSHAGKLYNCAAVCLNGRVLGFVPKKNIPNYSEFYEARHFTPWDGGFETVPVIRFNTIMGNMTFASYDDPDFIKKVAAGIACYAQLREGEERAFICRRFLYRFYNFFCVVCAVCDSEVGHCTAASDKSVFQDYRPFNIRLNSILSVNIIIHINFNPPYL